MKKVLSLVLVLALAIMPMLSFAAVPISGLENGGDPSAVQGLDGIVKTAVGIVTYVGYAVAVVMVLWLGVQWILATPAKKAELKGKMWSMAIGIVLLVGGVTIINFVWGAAETGTSGL